MTAQVGSRLQRLQSFLQADAGNVALRKDAIREACDTGQWQIAQELIEAGLLIGPDDAGLLGHAGFVHLQQQRYDDAERVLSAALAQGLDTPELHYNLAFAIFMQRRYEAALEHLNAPLLPLELPLARLLKARCLHHLGRRPEAIEACWMFLVSAPDHAEAHGLLALLLNDESQQESAAEHVQAALTRDPQQLEALLAHASMQFAAHSYDEARRSFESLVKSHPDCGRGWLGLALVDLNLMRMDAARRSIELATKHSPDHLGGWHILGWIHLVSGDVASAQQAFERALEVDGRFSESHGGLAIVAAMQGRQEDARRSIKLALRLDRDAMSPQYALLLLLQQEGLAQEAQAVLDDFLARPAPRSDMSYRDMVEAHQRYLRSRVDPLSS